MITGSSTSQELQEPTPEPVDAGPVEEVLRALAAALRSYRLYERNNPMVDRFVSALRERFLGLWDILPHLRLTIEEHAIRWEQQVVFTPGDSGVDLPFTFYKDGVRELTILPGIEEAEVISLLEVLARAGTLREDEDDLITLLWQEELSYLRYRAVELSADGVELYTASEDEPDPLNPQEVREDAAAPQQISADDFQESLYFLDESDLRRIQEEVRKEAGRDLWRDVVNALLDRLEDGDSERQIRIVGIFRELLPTILASGEFDRAAGLLEEFSAVAAQPGVLTEDALRQIRDLFEILGTEDTITQLTAMLENSPERLGDGSVPRLLAFFPPTAILPLMRAVERTQQPAVRRALEGCVDHLAASGREAIVALLDEQEPAVLAAALGWIGRLKISAAAGDAVRLLSHHEPTVREAAIGALALLDAGSSGKSILPLLRDPVREVRVAACRALGSLRLAAARPEMEEVLALKQTREADRTEKLALFEAFGRVAGAEGVPLLDKVLNGRGWFGKSESSEIRACAAIGLAVIDHPSALKALQTASQDRDPVVRSAVSRALRGGVQ